MLDGIVHIDNTIGDYKMVDATHSIVQLEECPSTVIRRGARQRSRVTAGAAPRKAGGAIRSRFLSIRRRGVLAHSALLPKREPWPTKWIVPPRRRAACL